jgi:lambda repressor-like predicted transcriptional regulator
MKQFLSISPLVALTGSSSKQQTLVSRLAARLATALVATSTDHRQGPPVRQRQTQRRLTAEQTQQVTDEYEAGASMKELAARWDLHRTTVAAQLRQAGVQLRRQASDTLLDEAIRLYNDGWSCRRLAERYGCDAETVRQTLKQAGVRLRAPWERR